MDNTIKFWDFSTGNLIDSVQEHKAKVNSVKVTIDGRYIITGSDDKTLKIWDRSARRVIRTLEGHEDAVQAVIISPDNKFIFSCSDDSTIRIWDFESGRCLKVINGPNGVLFYIAITPDNQKLIGAVTDEVTGYIPINKISTPVKDNQIWIWDVASGVPLHIIKGFQETIWNLAVSPNGRYVIGACKDGIIDVWEISTGILVRTFEGHKGGVVSLAISPDGNYIYSGSQDKTVKVWEFESSKELCSFPAHDNSLQMLSITTDNCYLITTSNDKTVKIWENTSETIEKKGELPEAKKMFVSQIIKNMTSLFKDEKERKILEKNLMSLMRFEFIGEFKYCMIAMGSIIEFLLTRYCKLKGIKPENFIDTSGSEVVGKGFSNFLTEAIKNNLFNQQKRWELIQNYLRDFRNYVHIQKEAKSDEIDENWYVTIKPAFDAIINTFQTPSIIKILQSQYHVIHLNNNSSNIGHFIG